MLLEVIKSILAFFLGHNFGMLVSHKTDWKRMVFLCKLMLGPVAPKLLGF